MILQKIHKKNELPYIWPSQNRKRIFNKIKEKRFKHIHLSGKSGSGKSRYLYELINILKKDNSNVIIDCSCHEERNKNTPMWDIINDTTLSFDALIESSDIYDLIEKTAKTKDVVIVIDDLHYAHDHINHFIEKLIHSLTYIKDKDCSISLITASRKPFPLKTTHNFTELKFDGLSSTSVQNLISKESLKNKTIKTFKDNIIDSHISNPLYLTELVNILPHLGKSDFLQIESSKLFAVKNIDELYTLIFSGLHNNYQKILSAASIIGKKFSENDIIELLPEYQDTIKNTLEHLHKNNFLVRYKESDKYSFTHDKQLECIYKNTSLNDRWSLHLSQAEKHKNNRQYDLAGYHYFFSEAYEESIKYLSYTARKALRDAEPLKAEIFIKRALKAFEISYLTQKHSYFKLQADYCYLLLMQGRLKEAEETFKELRQNNNAKAETSKRILFELEIKIKWMSGKHPIEYVIKVLDSLPKSPSYFTDRSRLVGMLSDFGAYHESITRTKELLADIEKSNTWKDRSFSPTEMACTVLLSVNYAALDDTDTAMKYIHDNLQNINKTPDSPQKIHTLTFTAKALHKLNKYDQAKPLIEKAYELNLDFKIGIIHPHILSQYAHNLAFFGDTIKALMLFDECISFNEEHEYRSSLSYYKILMAKVYSSMCMERVAFDILKSAEKIALTLQNDYHLALIYYELSLIGINTPDIIENNTKEYLLRSIHIAQKLNIKSLEDKCHNAYKCIS